MTIETVAHQFKAELESLKKGDKATKFAYSKDLRLAIRGLREQGLTLGEIRHGLGLSGQSQTARALPVARKEDFAALKPSLVTSGATLSIKTAFGVTIEIRQA